MYPVFEQRGLHPSQGLIFWWPIRESLPELGLRYCNKKGLGHRVHGQWGRCAYMVFWQVWAVVGQCLQKRTKRVGKVHGWLIYLVFWLILLF